MCACAPLHKVSIRIEKSIEGYTPACTCRYRVRREEEIEERERKRITKKVKNKKWKNNFNCMIPFM